MPTDNYDASLVTARKRAATIRNYKTTLATVQNTMNYNVVAKEQVGSQTGAFVVLARSGNQGCGCDTSMPGYVRRVVGLTGATAPDDVGDYDLYNPIYENDAVNNPGEN